MKLTLKRLLFASRAFKSSVNSFVKGLEAASTVSKEEITPDSVGAEVLLPFLLMSSLGGGISAVKSKVGKAEVTDFEDIKRTVMKNEGFVEKAYKLSGESGYSIGFGFYKYLPDGREITEGMTITREEAERLLDVGLSNRRDYVLRQVEKYGSGISLNDQQINVLLDLAWQSGRGVERVLRASKGDVNKIIEELKTAASEHLESKDANIKAGVKKRDLRRSLAFAMATPGVSTWEGIDISSGSASLSLSGRSSGFIKSLGFTTKVNDKIPAREEKKVYEVSIFTGLKSSGIEYSDIVDNPNHPDYTPEEWVARGAFLSSPVASTRITSKFGHRDQPTAGASTYHKGVDYGHRPGESTLAGDPIYSIADGVIVKKYYSNTGGNQIVIYHGNGIVSGYSHLSKYADLEVGSSVRKGQIIGYVGNTGVGTGAHLHFSIRVGADTSGNGGTFVDPLKFLDDYKAYYEKNKVVEEPIYYSKDDVKRYRNYGDSIFNRIW